MKHIKTYEETLFALENRLKVGDYILVNTTEIEPDIKIKYDLPKDDILPAKIIEINNEYNEYNCKFENGVLFYVLVHEIIRYLTNEEIDNLNIKINKNKYNL